MTVDRLARPDVANVPELLGGGNVACLQWGFHEAALACGDFRIEDVDPILIADAMIGWLTTFATECAADDEQFKALQDLLNQMSAGDENDARWLTAAALIGDRAREIPPIEQTTNGLVSAWFGYSGAWVQVSHAVPQQQPTGTDLQLVSDAVPNASVPTGASGPLVVPDVSPYPLPGVTRSRGWLAAFASEQRHSRLRMVWADSGDPI